MDFYKGNIPIYDFNVPADRDHLFPKGESFGYDPQSRIDEPHVFGDPPSAMEVIPRSEWDARYDEQEATKSSLEHIFLSGPNNGPAFINLDQNGNGYCWAYSTGHALMLDRLKRGLPLVRLNPHGPAAIIKHGADQGGWCGTSAKFAREHGYPEEGTGPGQWPLHSRNLKYDTPECRAQMAKRKVTEDWYDLTKQDYNQVETQLQLATSGFNNIPTPSDFNPWSHSVCQVRWVRTEAGAWGPLILNSWKGWGRFGLGVLRWTADNAVGIRTTTIS